MQIIKRNYKRYIVISIVWIILFYTFYNIFLSLNLSPPFVIDISLSSNMNQTARIYYDTGHGFSENQMVEKQVRKGPSFKDVTFYIFSDKIKNFRLDPGNQISIMKILNFCLKKFHIKKCLTGRELEEHISMMKNISKTTVMNDQLFIYPSNNDPYIFFSKNMINELTSIQKKVNIIFNIIKIILVSLLSVMFIKVYFSRKKLVHFFRDYFFIKRA